MAAITLPRALTILSDLATCQTTKMYTEGMDRNGAVWAVYVDGEMSQRYKSKIVTRATVAFANASAFRARRGNAISVTKESKVITYPANYHDAIEPQVTQYLNSPEVPIRDALQSPPKTRMTVTTKVNKVFDLATSASGAWSRRDLMLDFSVKMKLWGDKANNTEHLEGKQVNFRNVEVDEFNGVRCLQSTAQTSFTVVDDVPRVVRLIAANADEDKSVLELLTEDGEVIEADQEHCPAELSQQIPCDVTVTILAGGRAHIAMN